MGSNPSARGEVDRERTPLIITGGYLWGAIHQHREGSRLGKKLGEGEEGEEKKGRGGGRGGGGVLLLAAMQSAAAAASFRSSLCSASTYSSSYMAVSLSSSSP
jgi:hypothetical protein